jgi:hypothetical protein
MLEVQEANQKSRENGLKSSAVRVTPLPLHRPRVVKEAEVNQSPLIDYRSQQDEADNQRELPPHYSVDPMVQYWTTTTPGTWLSQPASVPRTTSTPSLIPGVHYTAEMGCRAAKVCLATVGDHHRRT